MCIHEEQIDFIPAFLLPLPLPGSPFLGLDGKIYAFGSDVCTNVQTHEIFSLMSGIKFHLIITFFAFPADVERKATNLLSRFLIKIRFEVRIRCLEAPFRAKKSALRAQLWYACYQLTEKAFKNTKHWMIPSIVSPVRQNVPLKCLPLRPNTVESDACTIARRCVANCDDVARALELVVIDLIRLSHIRRSNDSMVTSVKFAFN